MKIDGKVKKLFLTAADLTAEDRVEYLDRECGDDEDLRQELERLLRFEEKNSLSLKVASATRPSGDTPEYDSENESTKLILSKPGIRPGKNIKHYRIIALIDKGGMGDVYLADDLKLDRKVALKVLSKEWVADKERLARFVQEAKAASSLNNPNIITVHEIDSADGFVYIVSEYVDGKTLSKLIDRGGLSLREKIDIAKQIASALSAAHDAGIIHRDIKPDNVMLRKDGLVKVLDFGLAKTTAAATDALVEKEARTRAKISTSPGMVMGTPHYMSPEQANGQEVDLRTDIFSFGVLFYELITGHLPFGGGNAVATIASILHKDPKPIDEFLTDPPEGLVEIINITLKKNRDERYPSIREVLEELESLLEILPSGSRLRVRTPEGRRHTTARNTVETWIAGHFSYVVLAAVLGVMSVFASLGWWYLNSDSTTSEVSLSGPQKTVEIVSWPSAAGELFSTGTFSPDGKLVAYGSTRSGTVSISVAQTNSGQSIPITEDKYYDRFPIWSPDGEELAFYSTRGGKPGIWRVSHLGGQLKQIGEITDYESRPRKWSPNGYIYYQGKNNLYKLDNDTGKSTAVTQFTEEGVSPDVIRVSPDESQIAFAIDEGSDWKIKTRPISGGVAKEITKFSDRITGLAWHPDGSRLFFTGFVEGVHQIFATSVTGGAPVLVSEDEIDSHINDISPDGRFLLFSSALENSDIWRVDLATAEESVLTSDRSSEMWATVSADNDQIAYLSIKNLSRGNKLTTGSIMTMSIFRPEQPLVIATGFLPEWAPDGQKLAYLKRNGQKYELWITSKIGSQARLLSKNGVQGIDYSLTPYNSTQPNHISWSPDGTSLVYPAINKEIPNLRIVDAATRRDRTLTNTRHPGLRFLCPVWSKDGKFIAFASMTRSRNKNGDRIYGIWSLEVESGKSKVLYESKEVLRLLGFSGSNRIVFAHWKPGVKFTYLPSEVDINEVSVDGAEKHLVRTIQDAYFFNIHLSPDSEKIAYVARPNSKDEILVGSLTGDDREILVKNDDPRLFLSSLAWSPDGKSIFYDKQTRFSVLSLLTNRVENSPSE